MTGQESEAEAEWHEEALVADPYDEAALRAALEGTRRPAVGGRRLTPRQQLFCRYMAAGGSATGAAIMAGYSQYSAAIPGAGC